MTFKVISRKTGKEPIFDHNHLFKEKWFKNSNLIWCDISGWAIDEYGALMLVDDCNNIAYPPDDKYIVIFDEDDEDGQKYIHSAVYQAGYDAGYWQGYYTATRKHIHLPEGVKK